MFKEFYIFKDINEVKLRKVFINTEMIEVIDINNPDFIMIRLVSGVIYYLKHTDENLNRLMLGRAYS